MLKEFFINKPHGQLSKVLLNHLCEKEIAKTIFYLLTFLRPCGDPWINLMQNHIMGASLLCSLKPFSVQKMKI